MDHNQLSFSTPEIKALLRSLKKEMGRGLPEPKKVLIYPSEDSDGDAVLRLDIIFSESLSPEETSWRKIYPFIEALKAELRQKTKTEMLILDRIVRLSELALLS